jgi:hypothetical protein
MDRRFAFAVCFALLRGQANSPLIHLKIFAMEIQCGYYAFVFDIPKSDPIGIRFRSKRKSIHGFHGEDSI